MLFKYYSVNRLILISIVLMGISCTDIKNESELNKGSVRLENKISISNNQQLNNCVNNFDIFSLKPILENDEHRGKVCFRVTDGIIQLQIIEKIPQKNTTDEFVDKKWILKGKKGELYDLLTYESKDNEENYRHHFLVFEDYILNYSIDAYDNHISGTIRKITKDKIIVVYSPESDSSKLAYDFDPESYIINKRDSIEYLENISYKEFDNKVIFIRELIRSETNEHFIENYNVPFYHSIGGKEYYSFFWDIFFGYLIKQDILNENTKV
jgi:hypothetical protein